MNSYINSHNERLTNQRRKLQYKQILDDQIREKKNQLKQSRFFTQGPYQYQRNSPRFQSIDIYNNNNSNRPRKFHQQSVFLPVINKSQSLSYERRVGGHQRVHSYGNQMPTYSQDTESQTVQALAQCQLIIQNLKKLVVSSTTRGIRRKISAPEDYHIPSYINYDNRYDKYGKGEAYGKYKQSMAQKQVMMFRAYQPNNLPKKKIRQKNKKSKSKQQTQRQRQSQISKTQRNKSNQNSALKISKKDENQSLQNSKIQQDQQNNEFQNSQSYIKAQMNQKSEQSIDSEQARAQQQEQKRRKKQKYWLKYLAKAKLRGAQLHQKIIQFKKKVQKQEDDDDQVQKSFEQQSSPSRNKKNQSPQKTNRNKTINSQPQIKVKERYLQNKDKKKGR